MRAQLPHQQTSAGQTNFGLRRARDDCPVSIAHDDVAQAQRRAAPFVALESECRRPRRYDGRRNFPRSPPSARASRYQVSMGPLESRHHRPSTATVANRTADHQPPEQTPHEGRTKPSDCPVPQIVPAPATKGACYPPAMRRVAHSDSMGAMAVLVLAPCHASGRAPRLTLAT